MLFLKILHDFIERYPLWKDISFFTKQSEFLSNQLFRIQAADPFLVISPLYCKVPNIPKSYFQDKIRLTDSSIRSSVSSPEETFFNK